MNNYLSFIITTERSNSEQLVILDSLCYNMVSAMRRYTLFRGKNIRIDNMLLMRKLSKNIYMCYSGVFILDVFTLVMNRQKG